MYPTVSRPDSVSSAARVRLHVMTMERDHRPFGHGAFGGLSWDCRGEDVLAQWRHQGFQRVSDNPDPARRSEREYRRLDGAVPADRTVTIDPPELPGRGWTALPGRTLRRGRVGAECAGRGWPGSDQVP